MWSFQWLDTGTGKGLTWHHEWNLLQPWLRLMTKLLSSVRRGQLSSSSWLYVSQKVSPKKVECNQWCKSGPTWLFFRFLHNKYCLNIAPAAGWTGRSKSRPRRQKLGDRELAIHNTRRSVIAEFLPWHGIYPRRHFPATVGTSGDTCCCHFEKTWWILLWPLSTCPSGGVRKTASKFFPVT